MSTYETQKKYGFLHIERFVSINGETIVRIARYRSTLDYDAACEDCSVVWGTTQSRPDSFCEVGRLESVLERIAAKTMVTAAAVASPKLFAQMVAAAHDLGLVISVGDMLILKIVNAQKYRSIQVENQSLQFHTLLPRNLLDKKAETPGIYSVSYSLSNYAVQRKVLVEELAQPG